MLQSRTGRGVSSIGASLMASKVLVVLLLFFDTTETETLSIEVSIGGSVGVSLRTGVIGELFCRI